MDSRLLAARAAFWPSAAWGAGLAPLTGRGSVLGRLVAGGAGNARGLGRLLLTRAFHHLLAAHHARVGGLVGAVLLRGRFGLAEIHLGRDLRLHIVLADHGLQDLQDAAHVLLLDLLGVVQLLHVHGVGVAVGRLRQQLARVVQDAHGRGSHLGHAGGHQVHDARDLRAVQHAARVQAQQHRGRRLLLLAEKAVLIGQGQMHACALHGGQGLDGARQLAFKAALEIEAFLELGDAELAVLHQLETRHRTLGQALGGQLQAHIVHAVGRDEDGTAAFRVAVRHVHLRQLGDDGATILVAQIGEQHLVVRLAVEHGRRPHGDNQQHGDRAPTQARATVHGRPALLQGRLGHGSGLRDRDFSDSRHLGSRCSSPAHTGP